MDTSMQRPATRVGTTALVEVVVTEELDVQAAPSLRALLDNALALRPEQLVVDLTDCPFVDAATVSVFLDVHRQAWRAGGRLVLRSPSARLRRILHLARVDHVLYMTPAPPPPAPADHGPTPVEGPGPTSP